MLLWRCLTVLLVEQPRAGTCRKTTRSGPASSSRSRAWTTTRSAPQPVDGDNILQKKFSKALLIEVEGPIFSRFHWYLNQRLDLAQQQQVDLIVLRLTSPGGIWSTPCSWLGGWRDRLGHHRGLHPRGGDQWRSDHCPGLRPHLHAIGRSARRCRPDPLEPWWCL